MEWGREGQWQIASLFFPFNTLENAKNNFSGNGTQMSDSWQHLEKARPPLCPLFFFLTITINMISMKVTQKMWVQKVKFFFIFLICHSTLHSAWMVKRSPSSPWRLPSAHSHGLWWTKACIQNPKLTQAPQDIFGHMINTEWLTIQACRFFSVPN